MVNLKGETVMNAVLAYKGYYGSMEYSEEDSCLFGKVAGIKSLISYEGASGEELKREFEAAIDEYLADCQKRGMEPEQSLEA